MWLVPVLLICVSLFSVSLSTEDCSDPKWASIEARPLPKWYDQAKFGIFVHWGVYSVPSIYTEWFWSAWRQNNTEIVQFMKRNYPPGFTYADFAPSLTAEFFDADRWAKLIQDSGAKYVIHTTKHCEGYTMYPSDYSFNWNSKDVGPNRDIIGEMQQAFGKLNGSVKFGLYFSLLEWFHPLYLRDKANNFTTQSYSQTVSSPQLHEIVNKYKPDIVWSDGEWEAPDLYWHSTEFLDWLYKHSAVKDSVVVNDRWGKGCIGKHGGYLTFHDQYDPGQLVKRKWENCMKMDQGSWGFRRTMHIEDVLPVKYILLQLARTVSCGGNLLLNVGPTHDGRIVPVFEQRLLSIGHWLKYNGQAIYSSRPWTHQNDTSNPDVWYTSKMTSNHLHPHSGLHNELVVYAIFFKWPQDNQLRLGAPKATNKTSAILFGETNHPLQVSGLDMKGIKIDLSGIDWTLLISFDAWVIQLKHVID